MKSIDTLENKPISFNIAVTASKFGFYKNPKEHNAVHGGWYNELGSYCGRIDITSDLKPINAVTHGLNFRDFYLKSYYAPEISVLKDWLKTTHNIFAYIDWVNMNAVVCGIENEKIEKLGFWSILSNKNPFDILFNAVFDILITK